MYNLDFLEEILKDSNDKIINQRFLKSDFNDNVWKLDFGGKKLAKINFDIKIHDGTELIKNKKLLNTIKYWILYVNYPTKGIELSPKKIRKNVVNVVTLIDLLNNYKLLNIKSEGLSLLTTDNIKFLIEEVSFSNKKSESVYDYSKKLGEYFKKNIKQENLPTVNNLNYQITEEDCDKLNLSKDEIVMFQNWVMKNEIKKRSYENSLYLIAKEISNNTLIKELYTQNRYPECLKVNHIKYIENREMNSYYVDSEETLLNKSSLDSYKKAFLKLCEIEDKNNLGMTLPININKQEIVNFIPNNKEIKRFQPVPSESVFYAIKEAIVFLYDYSEDLLKSYENIVRFMTENKMKKLGVRHPEWLNNCFTDKLKNIGVETWYLPNEKNRFEDLRKNKSFYGLLKVYYGMVQVVVGALMARRQSEMLSLKNHNCLNPIDKTLMFHQSKSSKGLFGTKNTLSLPIDDIAIDMIKNIQKFNNILNPETESPLFLLPMYNNPIKKSNELKSVIYNSNLDYFFDYIKMTEKEGKRLYFRQHQLRRFFAMTFFWNNKGSMDTLRWFLGHTDVEHLYNYITENSKGSVLKNVKTQYIIENEKDDKSLLNLIKREYNCEDFEIIEEEDLEYYIEDLLEKEKIDIEPDFFSDDNGTNYDIIFKIKEGK